MRKIVGRGINQYNHSQAVQPLGATGPGRTHSPCRILVVDKSSDLRLLYSDALAGPGCRVDVAENGAAAWKALQARRYHLLVTENELPNLTGDLLIKKLHAAGMDLPVVILVESLPERDPARSPLLPCAAKLLKPFTVDALLDTVINVLRAAVPPGNLPLSLPAAIRGQEMEQDRERNLQSPDSAAQPIAITLSVRGECRYSRDGARFAKLERGQVLEQGALVRTGPNARTDLLFRRTGSSVRLQGGTEIRLEKMAFMIQDGRPVTHTLLVLHTGSLLTVVHSTVAGSTLEIRNEAGRAVAETSGLSRCIITADGTHVWAQGAAMPIKVRGENGSTIIAAGRHSAGADGAIVPVSTDLKVKDLIQLDELQAAMETFAAGEPPPKA